MRRVYFSLTFLALLVFAGCGGGHRAADEVMNPAGEVASQAAQDGSNRNDQYGYFDTGVMLGEDDYSGQMQRMVEPYLNDRMEDGTLITERGSEIHWEVFTADGAAAKGKSDAASAIARDRSEATPTKAATSDTIVMFEGFSEFTRKHDETTYYFLRSGYNVCIFDHMGLGLSGRDKAIDGDKNAVCLVYIDNFDTYVEDAAEVVERVARPVVNGTAPGGRLLLYAHSMGGCIGALVLEQHPDMFDAAVLSSPMLATNTGVPEWMAYSLSAVMDAFGMGAKMAVGQKTYAASTTSKRYAPAFADSVPRVEYKAFLRKGDTHYQTTAATYSWTYHAVKATHQAVKSRNIRNITTPILMFQSEHDNRVRPAGQNRFRRRSDGVEGLSVTLVYYPGVRHEIFNSHNEYIAPYYDRILRFYAAG